MLIGTFLSGLGNLTGLTTSASVIELLPHWAVMFWAVLIMFTSSLCVWSNWIRDRVMGLLLERIGLYGLGGTCMVYGVAIIWVFRQDGSSASMVILSIGVASFWRAKHVNNELRALKKFIEEVMK